MTFDDARAQLFDLLETGGGVVESAKWLGIVSQLESDELLDAVYAEGHAWRAEHAYPRAEYFVGEDAE